MIVPHARTALLPTDREIDLARGFSHVGKTQQRIANLLARYRVELLGLDGKGSIIDPRVPRAREVFQEIQELAASAAAEMRTK